MTELEEAKKVILEHIRFKSNTSFVELEQELEAKNLVSKKEGELYQVNNPEYKNVIFWISDNSLLTKGVNELFSEKKIVMNQCQALVYAMDGKVLNLPEVKQVRDYTEPHWLPAALNINPEKVPPPTEEEMMARIREL